MARTIAITGKGGVGKTVIAALIVRHLAEHTPGPILALDADPDANLAAMLGLTVQTTIGDLREDVLSHLSDLPAGISKAGYLQAGLHQIIVETPKVDLITMGRGEGPGCYCFINNVLRAFADDLMPSYRWLVMDNEAGLEHLSRRTASRIDHLIVVVNDNPMSHGCAERIDRVVEDIHRAVGGKHILINGVRADRVAAVAEKIAPLGLEYLGAVPYDEALERAVFDGRSVYDLENGPAVTIMGGIMQKIGVG